MKILRQSTVATIKLGTFVDDTDGKTPETGLTIAQADIRLSKNGGAFAQTNNVAGATHDENGWYGIPLDTTDTNTLGRLQIAVYESGALPCFEEFMIVTANYYDSMCSTDKLEVDLTQISGVAQSATDLKDFADAGYDPATNKVQGVVLVDTTTTNTDMVGTNGAALASVCTAARLGELDAANLPTDVANVKTDTASILIDTGTTLDGKMNTIDTNVDTILVDTNELQTNQGAWATATGFATANEYDTEFADIKGTGFIKDTHSLPQCLTGAGGSAPTVTEIRIELDDNSTKLSSILTDTGTTIPSDLTTIKGATFDTATDSLEAIRNRGDSAWSASATNPNVLVDTTIAGVTDQTHFTLTAGSDVDDAYNDQAIVLYDASNSDYPSIRKISNYVGATKTVTLDSASDFTIVPGDGIKTFVTAPGTTAPTAGQVADAVWDEPTADHTSAGSTSKSIIDINTNLEFLKDMEGGAWDVLNNQMVFYKSDNVTELCRFNLFNKRGTPTNDHAYKRERV